MRFQLPRMLLLFLLFSVAAHAATPRILLVGDSYAWFLWLDKSFQTALEKDGLGEYSVEGQYTTIPGSMASQWTNPAWLAVIDRELNAHPTIHIVHLSLCGNDFLRGWRKDMPLEARDKLFAKIMADFDVVVKHCLGVRPNIKVAIADYDYINHPKGKASIQEVNEAGMIVARMKKDYAAKMDRVEYVQMYGLMQYEFGYPPDIQPHAVPYPGQAPNFDPFPGGNPALGNPKDAMFDTIHLSQRGYEVMAQHCIKVLYGKWLEHPEAVRGTQTASNATTAGKAAAN